MSDTNSNVALQNALLSSLSNPPTYAQGALSGSIGNINGSGSSSQVQTLGDQHASTYNGAWGNLGGSVANSAYPYLNMNTGIGAPAPLNAAGQMGTQYANPQGYNQAMGGYQANLGQYTAPDGNYNTVMSRMLGAWYTPQGIHDNGQAQPGQDYSHLMASTQTPATSQQVGTQQFSGQALQPYMDPYNQQVTDSTLSLLSQQQARQKAAQNAQMASAQNFGTRSQFAQAALDEDQSLAYGQTAAGLKEQGYQTALGQYNADQGRKLTADQGNQSADLNAQGLSAQKTATGLNADIANRSMLGNLGYQYANANLGAQNTAAGLNNALLGKAGDLDISNRQTGIAGTQAAAADASSAYTNTMAGLTQLAGIGSQEGAFDLNNLKTGIDKFTAATGVMKYGTQTQNNTGTVQTNVNTVSNQDSGKADTKQVPTLDPNTVKAIQDALSGKTGNSTTPGGTGGSTTTGGGGDAGAGGDSSGPNIPTAPGTWTTNPDGTKTSSTPFYSDPATGKTMWAMTNGTYMDQSNMTPAQFQDAVFHTQATNPNFLDAFLANAGIKVDNPTAPGGYGTLGDTTAGGTGGTTTPGGTGGSTAAGGGAGGINPNASESPTAAAQAQYKKEDGSFDLNAYLQAQGNLPEGVGTDQRATTDYLQGKFGTDSPLAHVYRDAEGNMVSANYKNNFTGTYSYASPAGIAQMQREIDAATKAGQKPTWSLMADGGMVQPQQPAYQDGGLIDSLIARYTPGFAQGGLVPTPGVQSTGVYHMAGVRSPMHSLRSAANGGVGQQGGMFGAFHPQHFAQGGQPVDFLHDYGVMPPQLPAAAQSGAQGAWGDDSGGGSGDGSDEGASPFDAPGMDASQVDMGDMGGFGVGGGAAGLPVDPFSAAALAARNAAYPGVKIDDYAKGYDATHKATMDLYRGIRPVQIEYNPLQKLMSDPLDVAMHMLAESGNPNQAFLGKALSSIHAEKVRNSELNATYQNNADARRGAILGNLNNNDAKLLQDQMKNAGDAGKSQMDFQKAQYEAALKAYAEMNKGILVNGPGGIQSVYDPRKLGLSTMPLPGFPGVAGAGAAASASGAAPGGAAPGGRGAYPEPGQSQGAATPAGRAPGAYTQPPQDPTVPSAGPATGIPGMPDAPVPATGPVPAMVVKDMLMPSGGTAEHNTEQLQGIDDSATSWQNLAVNAEKMRTPMQTIQDHWLSRQFNAPESRSAWSEWPLRAVNNVFNSDIGSQVEAEAIKRGREGLAALGKPRQLVDVPNLNRNEFERLQGTLGGGTGSNQANIEALNDLHDRGSMALALKAYKDRKMEDVRAKYKIPAGAPIPAHLAPDANEIVQQFMATVPARPFNTADKPEAGMSTFLAGPGKGIDIKAYKADQLAKLAKDPATQFYIDRRFGTGTTELWKHEAEQRTRVTPSAAPAPAPAPAAAQ